MRFKIWSPPHTMFAANLLVEQLRLQGHTAAVVPAIETTDTDIYIIYCAAKVKHLPKHYIVYQTEINGSPWFTPHYLQVIKNALCVWEYCEANCSAYKKHNSNIAIVPPGIAPQVPTVKNIPVLFYGWVEGSPRRHRILKEIAREVPVQIVQDKLQGQMWQLLSRANVVLNLHFYEHSPLEQFRVNEALSFNCHVVSERSQYGDANYKGLVKFGDNSEQLIKHIKAAQNKVFKLDIRPLDNREQIREGLKLISPAYLRSPQ